MDQPIPTCVSCGTVLGGPYCSTCGEKQLTPRDLKIWSLIADFFGGLLNLDGRVPRTLWTLVSRPGRLTRAWWEGRRIRFARPFALFLGISLVFFLLQPHSGILSYGFDQVVYGRTGGTELHERLSAKLAASELSEQAFRERFNAILQAQKQSFFVVMIPLLAVASALLRLRRRAPGVVHLVFSIHYFVAFLILLSLLILAGLVLPDGSVNALLFGRIPGLGDESTFLVFLAVFALPYLTLAYRAAFGDAWTAAILRALALFASQLAAVLIYQQLILRIAARLV